jgi:hypothetical protein
MADTDPSTGVTTCIGTGTAAGCTGAFACPAPAAGKMTVCGQIYNFVDDTELKDAQPTGNKCSSTTTTTGPCALVLNAYNANTFATNPQTAPPLSATFYMDDCGRFRLTDIADPGFPLIGIGIDDAAAGSKGPGGVTQPVGIGFLYAAGMAVPGAEAYVVSKAQTDAWDASTPSGGPTVATGLYAMTFRVGKTGLAAQAGVSVYKSATQIMSPQLSYFSNSASRTTLDGTATSTSANGSALVTGAGIADSLTWTGVGAFTGADATNCDWEKHGGISLPGIVFVQNYRPTDKILKTCGR